MADCSRVITEVLGYDTAAQRLALADFGRAEIRLEM
jgi:hypothetical protein